MGERVKRLVALLAGTALTAVAHPAVVTSQSEGEAPAESCSDAGAFRQNANPGVVVSGTRGTRRRRRDPVKAPAPSGSTGGWGGSTGGSTGGGSGG